MVDANKLVMLLVKVPIPEPLTVLASEIVGLGDVLQQTPRCVTVEPPLELIFPPLLAVPPVIREMAVVVRLGKSKVVNISSCP